MNQRLPAAATKIQTAGIVQITGCAVHNPDRLKISLEKYCPTIALIIGDKGTRGQGDKEKEISCPLSPLLLVSLSSCLPLPSFDIQSRIVYTGRQLADCHCRPF